MVLRETNVNQQVDRERADSLFSRPAMPNVPTYNLASGAESRGGPLRQAGGYVR